MNSAIVGDWTANDPHYPDDHVHPLMNGHGKPPVPVSSSVQDQSPVPELE